MRSPVVYQRFLELLNENAPELFERLGSGAEYRRLLLLLGLLRDVDDWAWVGEFCEELIGLGLGSDARELFEGLLRQAQAESNAAGQAASEWQRPEFQPEEPRVLDELRRTATELDRTLRSLQDLDQQPEPDDPLPTDAPDTKPPERGQQP